MTIKQVDWLNVGLILISLVLAFYIPFRLFIIAYALLGPLHYLTEINWLERRNFFVNRSRWVGLFVVLALVYVLPYLPRLEPLIPFFGSTKIKNLSASLGAYSNLFIFLPFVLSFPLILMKKRSILPPIAVFAAVFALLINHLPFYLVFFGSLLPTVLHVYLFTMLFMLYGGLKSQSVPAYFGVGLAAACPLIIAFADISSINYLLPELFKKIYTENAFHYLPAKLAGLLGLSDGTEFYFYEQIFLKLQIFIAFAYCYHYLNWFSKTSLIKWHQDLNKERTWIILLIWVASVALYAYDYKLGFVVLLFLSTLHIFLEFPLNVLSVKGIAQELRRRF